MNILITGASRGIGAAAYALLKSTGHNVAGHSSRGSDELIAGDLSDSAAPRRIWEAALGRLGARIDVLVNNAGIYEIVADIPLGRVATTDEVAETIRWLAVDAPASATGSVIDVNGASYVR